MIQVNLLSARRISRHVSCSFYWCTLFILMQDTRVQSSSSEQLHHTQFVVRQDLVGLAIGAQGCNISAARRIEGISSIDLNDDTCTFQIRGEVSISGFYMFILANVLWNTRHGQHLQTLSAV